MMDEKKEAVRLVLIVSSYKGVPALMRKLKDDPRLRNYGRVPVLHRGSPIEGNQHPMWHPHALIDYWKLFKGEEPSVAHIMWTNSEHIIRQSMLMVGDQTIKQGEVEIWWIPQGTDELDEDGDPVYVPGDAYQVVLNEYGQATNWPDQFFGDAIGITERHMDAVTERMESAKEQD